MAFETAQVATREAMLDAFRQFLTANGWTQDRWDTVSGFGRLLNIHRGDYHVAFMEDPNLDYGNYHYSGDGPALLMKGYTAFDSNEGFDSQPGEMPSDSPNHIFSMRQMAEPLNRYWFFAYDNPMGWAMVCESQPGVFQHLLGGMLNKTAGLPGGQWYEQGLQLGSGGPLNMDEQHIGGSDHNIFGRGTRGNTQIAPYPLYMPFDGEDWHRNTTLISGVRPAAIRNESGGTLHGAMTSAAAGAFGDVMGRSINTVTAASPMIPHHYYKARPEGRWSMFGFASHVRVINIWNLVAAQEISIGGAEWVVFPHRARGLGLIEPWHSTQSGAWGIAYRKVT